MLLLHQHLLDLSPRPLPQRSSLLGLHVVGIKMSPGCSYNPWVYLRALYLWLAYAYFPDTVRATTIASWVGLRAALTRDSIFLEGGFLTWGDWDEDYSSYLNLKLDPALGAPIYKLDLAQAFNSSSPNSLLQIVNDTVTDDRPSYYFGSMFVDANGFVLFGYVLLASTSTPVLANPDKRNGKQTAKGQCFFRRALRPAVPVALQ